MKMWKQDGPGSGRISKLMAATLVGIGGAFNCVAADAADWTLSGNVSETGSYDDNVRLNSSGEISSFVSRTVGELTIRGRTERSEIEIKPSVSLGFYEDDSSLNYFDQSLGVDAQHNTLRGFFGIESELSNQTTLESELTDTGNLQSKGRRLEADFNPYFGYLLTERDTLA